MRRPGIKPGSRPWQGRILSLYYRRWYLLSPPPHFLARNKSKGGELAWNQRYMFLPSRLSTRLKWFLSNVQQSRQFMFHEVIFPQFPHNLSNSSYASTLVVGRPTLFPTFFIIPQIHHFSASSSSASSFPRLFEKCLKSSFSDHPPWCDRPTHTPDFPKFR